MPIPIYNNNALLYSNTVTAELADLRTGKWHNLVTHVVELADTHEDALAFQLAMIELCGCLRCKPGAYRLALGCHTCATRTVSNYSGSDASLVRRFEHARREVRSFLSKHEEDRER